MAPKLEHKIIGIRVGEKLHETMINIDDARNTLSLGNKYIIMPSIEGLSTSILTKMGAKKVEDGFTYQSDTNPETLNVDQVKKTLDRYLNVVG